MTDELQPNADTQLNEIGVPPGIYSMEEAAAYLKVSRRNFQDIASTAVGSLSHQPSETPRVVAGDPYGSLRRLTAKKSRKRPPP